jgi:hypothetical protein
MSESEDFMRRLQLYACRDSDVRLFRNNNGQGWVGKKVGTLANGSQIVLANARVIRFGLGVGTGDLIGGKSIVITPDMVGRRVLVFANVEVKHGGGRPTAEQTSVIEVVKSLGGLAGVVRSEDDVHKVLTLDLA